MDKKLNRREFVKGAAVVAAGAVLAGNNWSLVHQAAQSSKAKATEAADLNLEIERAGFYEQYEQLDPGRKQFVYDVACAMVADYQREISDDGLGLVHEAARALKAKVAKVLDPERQALREAVRSDLRRLRYYPTAQGIEAMQEEPGGRETCRAVVVEKINDLDDGDLLAIYILVCNLACA
jgi:hypothetical protein